MKRYWLFVWLSLRPLGGFNDFRVAYDNIEQKQYMQLIKRMYDSCACIDYQVIDSFSGNVVDQGQYDGE